MEFDKRTIIAFILIGLILIIANTDVYQKIVDPRGYELKQEQERRAAEQAQQPTQEPQPSEESRETISDTPPQEDVAPPPQVQEPERRNELFAQADTLDEKIVTVENEFYTATLSSKGATILQWELKKYLGPDNQPVRMFPPESYGNLALRFSTQNNDSIDTSNLLFNVDSKRTIVLGENDSTVTINFTLPVGDNRSITKSYTFHHRKYRVDMDVTFQNMQNVIDEKRYFVAAPNGLASTEERLKDDMMYAKAATASGGDVDKGYKANGKVNRASGEIDWAAVRTKYFAFYIIPESQNSNYVEIMGEQIPVVSGTKEEWKKYSVKMALPYLGDRNYTENFILYIGPLEYDILKSYNRNLQDFMDFGFVLIKPFSIGILKAFKWMHTFIPNYGVVLLIFAFLIKILVYPLTHKSYESMQKMQKLQPRLKELQEKYKNEPQKLNQATMKLYKEEGANPIGGCLPMLLQMPLLIGLFIVFRTTIELRGEGFALWINDLSAPDTIYTFPGNFSIPLYGNSVNILPLVMGVTMFIQQKMTITDPKQKFMVYFMPIFLTLLFNSFPSGLNLYYALFNLLTIIQQKYLTPKKVESQEPAQPVKKRKR